MILRMLTTILVFLASVTVALAEDLQIGLSDDGVSIESNFAGTEVAVFGAIEDPDELALVRNAYDVVVIIQGPPKAVVVRQKQRRFGIWINGAAQTFNRVPSFYTISSTGPLSEITTAETLTMLQLGFDNIQMRPLTKDESQKDDAIQQAVYKESLSRLRVANKLFVEDIGGVDFLSPTLFRARLKVPANIPIGHHRARAYLFRDGEFLITRSVLLEVAKRGFEQQTYNLAHRNGLLYGFLAVLIAIFTGWLASVIFRKD
ncbi:MAG: TIGR02186 family protein [Rhizobiaceae bacterium]